MRFDNDHVTFEINVEELIDYSVGSHILITVGKQKLVAVITKVEMVYSNAGKKFVTTQFQVTAHFSTFQPEFEK